MCHLLARLCIKLHYFFLYHIGDACEGDFDGDGVPDEIDNCPNSNVISLTDFRGMQTVDLCLAVSLAKSF